MMKLLCLLLALTSFVITAPSCAKTAYCMGCSATTADACTSCYNKGDHATLKPKAFASNACANDLTTTGLVTGCGVYSGTSAGTAIGARDCGKCTTAAHIMNITSASGVDTAVACEAAATHADCVAKENCTQQGCHSNGGSGEDLDYTALCMMCNSGYMGTALTNITGLGVATCIEITLENCLLSVVDAAKANLCYTCATGYAVASGLTTCLAYTADTNCRVLSTATECGECLSGYWFNGSKCSLTALVSVLSTMSLAIVALLN